MHYLFARTNNETDIQRPYFLSTSHYFDLKSFENLVMLGIGIK